MEEAEDSAEEVVADADAVAAEWVDAAAAEWVAVEAPAAVVRDTVLDPAGCTVLQAGVQHTRPAERPHTPPAPVAAGYPVQVSAARGSHRMASQLATVAGWPGQALHPLLACHMGWSVASPALERSRRRQEARRRARIQAVRGQLQGRSSRRVEAHLLGTLVGVLQQRPWSQAGPDHTGECGKWAVHKLLQSF